MSRIALAWTIQQLTSPLRIFRDRSLFWSSRLRSSLPGWIGMSASLGWPCSGGMVPPASGQLQRRDSFSTKLRPRRSLPCLSQLSRRSPTKADSSAARQCWTSSLHGSMSNRSRRYLRELLGMRSHTVMPSGASSQRFYWMSDSSWTTTAANG